MDKAKTLEVLRGMKFMQRKEEAKRRATFEVAQREEIERHLHTDGGEGASAAAAAAAKRSGPLRATVLYDDAFPTSFYGLARRAFTDTLGGGLPSAAEDTTEEATAALEELEVSKEGPQSSLAATPRADEIENDEALNSDEESVDDLWGGEDDVEDFEADPTAPQARGDSSRKAATAEQQQRAKKSKANNNNNRNTSRNDGRFTVQSAVRAPKLPRRLEEAVAEEERQRKRRRAEDDEDIGF